MLNEADDTAKQNEHSQADQHSKNSEHDVEYCQNLDVSLHGIHIARVVYLDLTSRSISNVSRVKNAYTVLHCRRWSGRNDARLVAGPCRSRCSRAGKAFR